MAWLLALCYGVTLILFVGAAWIAGMAGICDTCQGQDSTGTEIVLLIAGAVSAFISIGLTVFAARHRQ
jgi:hypothetical protein